MLVNDVAEIRNEGPEGDNFIIRFELQGMKASLLHHIQKRHLQIEQEIERICDSTTKNLDIQKLVEDAVSKSLQWHLKRAIEQSIDNAVREVTNDVIHKSIFKTVQRMLKDYIGKTK